MPLGFFGASKLEMIDVRSKQNNYNENAVIFSLLNEYLKNVNSWLKM